MYVQCFTAIIASAGWSLAFCDYRFLNLKFRYESDFNVFIICHSHWGVWTTPCPLGDFCVQGDDYCQWKVKVKCTIVQALRLCTGRTVYRGIALPFLEHGTRRGWGVSVTPRPLFTPGKTWYPLYRRLCGPHGRSGQVRKISPPPRHSIPGTSSP